MEGLDTEIMASFLPIILVAHQFPETQNREQAKRRRAPGYVTTIVAPGYVTTIVGPSSGATTNDIDVVTLVGGIRARASC